MGGSTLGDNLVSQIKFSHIVYKKYYNKYNHRCVLDILKEQDSCTEYIYINHNELIYRSMKLTLQKALVKGSNAAAMLYSSKLEQSLYKTKRNKYQDIYHKSQICGNKNVGHIVDCPMGFLLLFQIVTKKH